MSDIHLQLDRLAVGYRGKALISGMEIGVRRGEIVTLVGPNGSGKSTILKTITKQLVPVEGDVLLADGDGNGSQMRRLSQLTPAELAQKMAVVLTGRLQTELMTCREVVSMGRYPYTGRLGILSDADEQKVDEALAIVHASELSERPFDAVSDGERQRILLARAICQEPEIIVLDEPTSYLDIRHKLELLSILYRMARGQGITVVMSLHEIDLAGKISDRVICVRGGEIYACGTPSEVFREQTVRELYDLDPALGRFDVDRGSLELSFMREETAESAEVSESAEALGGCSCPRVMIAAPSSGSGKTLVTCGILRLLQRKDLHPAAFKCGPDYIDPMFHRQVLGVPSRNLDTFFTGGSKNAKQPQRCLSILNAKQPQRSFSISVIEGVMGYYDGTGASGMLASSFDLAQQTQTPVILVVNARGMSRSVVPLLKGFKEYEKTAINALDEPRETYAPQIKGVIMNRISKGMYPRMKKWIEEDTGLKVLGFVPQEDGFAWESRHLGLLAPGEIEDLNRRIDHLADILEETIDLEALTALAQSAPLIPAAPEAKTEHATLKPSNRESAPRIAVARDEAFSFYYEDNLDLLRECGAELVFFSPLHDKILPEAEGLLLGGGYPELYAKALSENEEMKAQISARAADGMPVLAECGGFMYLQEFLEAEDGNLYRMCGVLPGTCRKTPRAVRFGYVELTNKGTGGEGYLQEGHRIRGHEFHYYDSTDNGDACLAAKPDGQRSWDCMVVKGNIMAGFPHLYYPSDPAFAENFVRACRARKRS